MWLPGHESVRIVHASVRFVAESTGDFTRETAARKIAFALARILLVLATASALLVGGFTLLPALLARTPGVFRSARRPAKQHDAASQNNLQNYAEYLNLVAVTF
jgi:hypothetical protein